MPVAAPEVLPVARIGDDPPPKGAPLPNGGVLPPQPQASAVDPTTEIVAAGGWGWMAQQYLFWARTLPIPGDDLQRDFGIDIYQRMGLDPQLRAARRVLVNAALNQPLALTLPVKEEDTRYGLAARIRDFCQANLDRLPRGLIPTLAEVADAALTHGHKVSEILCEVGTLDPQNGPQLLLRDLKAKPLTSTAFVIDAYGNTLGLLAQRPGQPLILLPVIVSGDVIGQPLLPLAKFAILTWDEQNADLRGNSILRACYGFWWMKQQLLPLLLAYATRFGQPSLDVELPPSAADVQQTNADGTPAPAKTMSQAMLDAGLQYQGGGVFIHPNGSKVVLTEPKGAGYQVFMDAVTLYDNQMVKALLGATLAVNEGEHRSGTDSKTHQDVLSLTTLYIKHWIAAFVRQQILCRLVEWNYGADAVPLTPWAELGQTDPQDIGLIGQVIAQMWGPGNFMNPATMPLRIGAALDARMGFPVRTQEDYATLTSAQAAQQAQAQPTVATNTGTDKVAA